MAGWGRSGRVGRGRGLAEGGGERGEGGRVSDSGAGSVGWRGDLLRDSGWVGDRKGG